MVGSINLILIGLPEKINLLIPLSLLSGLTEKILPQFFLKIMKLTDSVKLSEHCLKEMIWNWSQPEKSDSYGATVANFAIFKASQFDGVPGFVNNPQDLPITYIQGNIFNSIQNFVSNGDFELSRINSGQLAVQTSNIPAWLIQNGELGLGSHYNINWNPTTQLVHLDSGKNLNYLTRVNLRRGRYQLSFDWAARDGKRFDTSQVIVRYNGKVLNTLVPVDYFCHRHIAIVDGIDGINTIELIGGGSADRFGASIDNVIIRNYAWIWFAFNHLFILFSNKSKKY